MATGPEPRTDLDGAAERVIGDGERLGALLVEERALLRARRFAAWEALLPEKQALLDSLDAASVDLRAALALQASPGPGLEAVVATARTRGDAGLAERLARVLDVVGHCRSENLANGRFIERLARHTHRALEIVTGAASDAGAVYGRDGNAVHAKAPRFAGHV